MSAEKKRPMPITARALSARRARTGREERTDAVPGALREDGAARGHGRVRVRERGRKTMSDYLSGIARILCKHATRDERLA
jgi:hypothetical protein